MVSFTGGTASGRAIGVVAAQRLIPAALEFGGKSPHIVFEDANLQAPVENIMGGIFERRGDRQSVVSGKSVSVRVVLGGRRVIKRHDTDVLHTHVFSTCKSYKIDIHTTTTDK